MKKAILYTVLVVTVVAALGAVGRMDVEAEKQEQQIQHLREQQMAGQGLTSLALPSQVRQEERARERQFTN